MTLPNLTQYTAPGVYWQNIPAPTSAPRGQSTTVVGIVGPGLGYRLFTDSITLTTTVPPSSPKPNVTIETLSQYGVNTGSVVVTSLDGSITYVNGSDYVLAQTAATDGETADTITTIVLANGSTITAGSTVVVSYHYTDYNYSTPTACSNFTTVKALYGSPFDPNTGAIISPLSFAAQIAFDNGALQLVLLDSGGGTRTDLANAYDLLDPIQNVNILVPLPVGITGTPGSPGDVINIGDDLGVQLSQDESQEDILRVGILGYESSVTVHPDVVAGAIGNKRVLEVWPWAMTYYNGYTNATQTLPGYYLAAAIAGVLAANPPQQGLTRQKIVDFSGIAPSVLTTMSNSYKDQLAASGVSVVEVSARSGALWCRHGVTTDTSSVYASEISLVRAQDALIELIEDTFEASALIGTPIGPETITTITGLITGALNSAASLGLIDQSSSVSVTQNPSYPTVIDVDFSYIPSYPLNVIEIAFSIDTTTGSVTNASTNGSA